MVVATSLGCEPFEFDFSQDIELVDRTVYPAVDVQALEEQGGVAAGATLPLGSFGGSSGEPVTYQIDNPEVLELSTMKNGDAHFLARSTGVARVIAKQGDKVAEVEVSVKPISASHVDLYPWHQFVQLPAFLWESGVAIFTSTNVTLAGVHMNSAGQVLGGFGATQWSITGEGDSQGVIMNKDLSDMVVYRSPAEPGVREEIRFGSSPPLEMKSVSVDEVAFIGLYVAHSFLDTTHGHVVEDGDAVEVSATSMLHLVLQTEDGRYITGTGGHTFELLDAETGQDLTGGFNSQGTEESMLHAGRAAFLDQVTPGVSVDAIVLWGEHSMNVTLSGVSDGAGTNP
jgi:hypothetical protein